MTWYLMLMAFFWRSPWWQLLSCVCTMHSYVFSNVHWPHMLSKANQVGDLREGPNTCGVFVSAMNGLVLAWITYENNRKFFPVAVLYVYDFSSLWQHDQYHGSCAPTSSSIAPYQYFELFIGTLECSTVTNELCDMVVSHMVACEACLHCNGYIPSIAIYSASCYLPH